MSAWALSLKTCLGADAAFECRSRRSIPCWISFSLSCAVRPGLRLMLVNHPPARAASVRAQGSRDPVDLCHGNVGGVLARHHFDLGTGLIVRVGAGFVAAQLSDDPHRELREGGAVAHCHNVLPGPEATFPSDHQFHPPK